MRRKKKIRTGTNFLFRYLDGGVINKPGEIVGQPLGKRPDMIDDITLSIAGDRRPFLKRLEQEGFLETGPGGRFAFTVERGFTRRSWGVAACP